MSHFQLPLPDFALARVLVAGDVMLDRYWYGDTGRISPEAPVPVVHVRGIEKRPGGAANVAMNLAALGLRPRLVGLVGDDEAADSLMTLLDAAGVEQRLSRRSGCSTVTKMRVMSRHQQLIRLDIEDGFDDAAARAFDGETLAALAGCEVVVFSDYGKGALQGVEGLIAAARDAGARVLVDPKGRDFRRYRGASVVTPNLSEFESVVGHCGDEALLAQRAQALCLETGIEALLITRGEHGMSLVTASGEVLHESARAREVYDVTGAGDTVIAVLAGSIAAGADLPTAVALANLAAGVVVGKLGTATVSVAELLAAARPPASVSGGMLSIDQALHAVALARAAGEKVVMTNGCFDILHAGHVQYLEAARALGDRLLVAVNSDASVRRLKGSPRPFNDIDSRMRVLAALRSVDWVVSFAEDTPAALVQSLSPDVLAKGGDYLPAAIAGADHVRACGGEIRVLPLREGLSTSALVDAIIAGRGAGS